MDDKVLGSQEIPATPATPAPAGGATPTSAAPAPTISGMNVNPTDGVDFAFYTKDSNPADRIFAGQSTPEQSADPWNKASDTIQKISDNSLNQINQNTIDTIGTERGGQRSFDVAGMGDNYMKSRYSTPVVNQLVSQFRTTAAQNALSTALENEKKRLTDEAQKAYKARQKRDKARAEAAARAAAQQAQAAQQAAVAKQIGGMGAVNGEQTTPAGQRARYENIDGNPNDVANLLSKGYVRLNPQTGKYENVAPFKPSNGKDYASILNQRLGIGANVNNRPAGTAFINNYADARGRYLDPSTNGAGGGAGGGNGGGW